MSASTLVASAPSRQLRPSDVQPRRALAVIPLPHHHGQHPNPTTNPLQTSRWQAQSPAPCTTPITHTRNTAKPTAKTHTQTLSRSLSTEARRELTCHLQPSHQQQTQTLTPLNSGHSNSIDHPLATLAITTFNLNPGSQHSTATLNSQSKSPPPAITTPATRASSPNHTSRSTYSKFLSTC